MELWRITPATKTIKTLLNIFEKKKQQKHGKMSRNSLGKPRTQF